MAAAWESISASWYGAEQPLCLGVEQAEAAVAAGQNADLHGAELIGQPGYATAADCAILGELQELKPPAAIHGKAAAVCKAELVQRAVCCRTCDLVRLTRGIAREQPLRLAVLLDILADERAVRGQPERVQLRRLRQGESVLRAVGGDGAQGDLAIFGIGEAEAVAADGKIAAHRLGVRISLQQQSIRAAVSGETEHTESAFLCTIAGQSLLAGEGEQPLQFTGELYEAAL